MSGGFGKSLSKGLNSISSKSKSGMMSEADTNCEPPVKNDETTDEARRL